MKQVVIVFDNWGDTAMYVDGVLHLAEPTSCDTPIGELCFNSVKVPWHIGEWPTKLSDAMDGTEVLNDLIEDQRKAIREIAAYLTPDQRISLRAHVEAYVDEIPAE